MPVAWLAARLANLTFSGLLEPSHDLEEKLVARIAESARFLAGREGNPDPLGLSPAHPKKRGLFQRTTPAADPPRAESVLDAWFPER